MFKIRKCNRNILIKISEIDIINSVVRKSCFLICGLGRLRSTQIVLWSEIQVSIIQNGWIFNLDESLVIINSRMWPEWVGKETQLRPPSVDWPLMLRTAVTCNSSSSHAISSTFVTVQTFFRPSQTFAADTDVSTLFASMPDIASYNSAASAASRSVLGVNKRTYRRCSASVRTSMKGSTSMFSLSARSDTWIY